MRSRMPIPTFILSCPARCSSKWDAMRVVPQEQFGQLVFPEKMSHAFISYIQVVSHDAGERLPKQRMKCRKGGLPCMVMELGAYIWNLGNTSGRLSMLLHCLKTFFSAAIRDSNVSLLVLVQQTQYGAYPPRSRV